MKFIHENYYVIKLIFKSISSQKKMTSDSSVVTKHVGAGSGVRWNLKILPSLVLRIQILENKQYKNSWSVENSGCVEKNLQNASHQSFCLRQRVGVSATTNNILWERDEQMHHIFLLVRNDAKNNFFT